MISTLLFGKTTATALDAAKAKGIQEVISWGQYMALNADSDERVNVFFDLGEQAFSPYHMKEVNGVNTYSLHINKKTDCYYAAEVSGKLYIRCFRGPHATPGATLYEFKGDEWVPMLVTKTPAEPGVSAAEYVPATPLPPLESNADIIDFYLDRPELRGKELNLKTILRPLQNLAGYLGGDPRENGLDRIEEVWEALNNELCPHAHAALFVFLDKLCEYEKEREALTAEACEQPEYYRVLNDFPENDL